MCKDLARGSQRLSLRCSSAAARVLCSLPSLGEAPESRNAPAIPEFFMGSPECAQMCPGFGEPNPGEGAVQAVLGFLQQPPAPLRCSIPSQAFLFFLLFLTARTFPPGLKYSHLSPRGSTRPQWKAAPSRRAFLIVSGRASDFQRRENPSPRPGRGRGRSWERKSLPRVCVAIPRCSLRVLPAFLDAEPWIWPLAQARIRGSCSGSRLEGTFGSLTAPFFGSQSRLLLLLPNPAFSSRNN